MNTLAKEQEKLFEKGISAEEFERRKERFLALYFQRRQEYNAKWWNNLSLEKRREIHGLILNIYKIKNKICRFSYEVLADKRSQTDRPIIFVESHIGKYDIEVVSEAIKDHYYLLSGDFEHLEGRIDAFFLGLNGVFYFNEIVDEDRKLVSESMINHLQNGGNLLFFIEGTWNLTPNLPMLPCYWGIVDIAKASNAIIIPLAVEQYERNFKINIGENFDITLIDDKSEAIDTLRDILSTLKWEIWETEASSRSEIESEYWEEYIKNRFKEWPYFNKNYISRLIFRPKNVVTPLDVYENISSLPMGYENISSEFDEEKYMQMKRIQEQALKMSPTDYAARYMSISHARKRVKIHQTDYF